MTAFSFQELVVTDSWESAALGTATGTQTGQYTAKDIGRAMKLGTAQNYVECASGDEIDGFIAAVEPFNVNDGASFGSIQRESRRRVKAGAAIAYGAYVMAGTPPAAVAAYGTAGWTAAVDSKAVVITDTHTTTRANWKFIRNFTNSSPSAAAVLNDEILIERI